MKSYLILPGQRVEIYRHYNGAGNVYYKINNKSGTNRINMWWTVGPFGSNKRLGFLSDRGSIEIKGFIWGRLKVGEADSETVIQIHDDPNVAMNFPPIHF